jgi:hypothetical protein
MLLLVLAALQGKKAHQVAADDAVTDVTTDDTSSALVTSTTAAPISELQSSQQVCTLTNVDNNMLK